MILSWALATTRECLGRAYAVHHAGVLFCDLCVLQAVRSPALAAEVIAAPGANAERQGFHRVREALSAHMWPGLRMKERPSPAAVPSANGGAVAAAPADGDTASSDPPGHVQRKASPAAAAEGPAVFGAYQSAAAAPAGEDGLKALGALPEATDPDDPPEEREFSQLMEQLAGAAALRHGGSRRGGLRLRSCARLTTVCVSQDSRAACSSTALKSCNYAGLF